MLVWIIFDRRRILATGQCGLCLPYVLKEISKKTKAASVLVLASALLGGCAADVNAEPESDGESSSAIVGGAATYSYPAVGVTVNGGATGCSATLVASNVILLAGHCFEPGRTEIAPWQFEIRKSGSESYRYPTGQGWALGREAGEDDVALLRLEKAVPSSVAKPLTLARSYPEVGNTMRMIGFGCTSRSAGGGRGTKRSISFGWGENKDASCSGDSGGALIAYPSSQVVGVTSGYNNQTGDDLFGWVPKHYDTLVREIEALR